MSLEFVFYTLAVFIAVEISGGLALYVWQRRRSPGATMLMLLVTASTGYSLMILLAMFTTSRELAYVWFHIRYVCEVWMPCLLLMIALEFAGRRAWLTPTGVTLLALAPLAATLTIAAGAADTRLWSTAGLQQQEWPFLFLRINSMGAWHPLRSAYFMSFNLAATVVLGWVALRDAAWVRRRQAIALMVGAWIPGLLNMLIPIVPLLSGHRIAITPFALALNGLVWAWALLRYRLFNLRPIARDTLIDNMDAAMLAIDDDGRIVDANPAVRRLTGFAPAHLIGQPAQPVLAKWHQDSLPWLQATASLQTEISLGPEGEQRYYDLRVSPLSDPNSLQSGRLVVLHDITARRRAEEAAQQAQQREMALASTIQTSLLPQAVPLIPGIDLAARSLPAREVGGDLYAYHKLPGGYGLTVGDVSGKGIPAALYMAVATTMLEAKASAVPDVAQLLAEMNTALYPHMASTRMNTALCYVRLEAAGAHYTAHIGNAGMVAPILKQRDGCHYLDIGGMPLGVMPESPAYRSMTLTLQPGDVLVLSSDGLVEAMNESSELYGFERLLARIQDAPGGSAQELQEWVLSDVGAFMGQAEQHDDMTLIVLRLTG
ncbi:MAG: SpoIIE family protein phosphatase [Thermoflexales bacterium]|nr:SpoIIE family protein phosphatase [Thermoflexales bacterium]